MQKATAPAAKGPTGKDAQPYEKSPIYRIMRDILRDSHVATARMGKSYKFTLGDAIRKYAQEATETVFLAYEERTDIAVKLERIRGIKPALHRLLIDIILAYLDCRRRKRNKRSAIAFETNFERNLEELLEEVNSGTYCIGPSQVFVVTYPKPREVWAAGFRDRIIHHLVYRDVAPWYESRFIEDTFSCIKSRGTQAAALRLEQFCRSATENWHKEAWCLQVDIANFFVSINRSILWEIMAQDMGEDSLTSRLTKQILFHDPTQNPYVRTPQLLHLVPRHKSLWHCKAGCGLPIGNLTSQFKSNVYLDALDKFVKHTLKVRWYVRYVDDAALISRDREQLYEWRDAIDEWLWRERGLRLHPNKVTVKPADSGINFVGTIVLPFRSYQRRMTIHSASQAA